MSDLVSAYIEQCNVNDPLDALRRQLAASCASYIGENKI